MMFGYFCVLLFCCLAEDFRGDEKYFSASHNSDFIQPFTKPLSDPSSPGPRFISQTGQTQMEKDSVSAGPETCFPM